MKGSLLPLIAKINSTDAPFLNLTWASGCSTDARWRQHRHNTQQTEGVPCGREWPMALHGYRYSWAKSEIVTFITSLQRQWTAGARRQHAIQRSGTAVRPVAVRGGVAQVGHGAIARGLPVLL